MDPKYFFRFLPTLLVGSVSLVLSSFVLPAINSIVFALILGILLNNFIPKNDAIESGTDLLGKRFLEIAILFLAFGIDYGHILALGINTFSIIVILMIVMVLITIALAKLVRFNKEEAWLIGFGTSVCGSTAIAALAPMVSAKKNDVASSMTIINVLGAIAMIAVPYLLIEWNSVNDYSGLILGGSLHSVGNVVGSAFIISDEVGEVALTVKMARIALLSPALIFFGLLHARGKGEGAKAKLKLPWYLIAFILISLFVSLVVLPSNLLDAAHFSGKLFLTMAMAAIGLQVNFAEMIRTGWRSLLFGLLMFFIQFAILIVLVLALG